MFSIQNITNRSLLAKFAQKLAIRKMASFGQNPWTNPFGKLSCLKSILFYPEYQKRCFLAGFAEKPPLRTMAISWPKTMEYTFWKIFFFFVLFQSSLLLSKKHSFVSRISNKRCFLAGYAQNPPFKKVAIFGQKLWTNPFGKFWFLGIFFFETWLFLSKQNSFLSRTSENDVSWLDLPKNHHWERWSFLGQKPWNTPFEKYSFFCTFSKFTIVV